MSEQTYPCPGSRAGAFRNTPPASTARGGTRPTEQLLQSASAMKTAGK